MGIGTNFTNPKLEPVPVLHAFRTRPNDWFMNMKNVGLLDIKMEK